MQISEQQRLEMYASLKNTHGDTVAETIMAHLPPSGWGDVLTRQEFRSELAIQRMELKAEMDAMRSKIETEMMAMEMRLSDKMNDLFRWAVATNLAVTGLLMAAMTAAIKFL